MTLSGLTVAIGRIVDDSIVVLENIFRHLQEDGDKRQAIITGANDVSVAIFSATVITVVVFIPLGLTGGIVGAFFLPFGLAVTYALLASFLVAITVVPVLVFLFVRQEDLQQEEAHGLPGTHLSARSALGAGQRQESRAGAAGGFRQYDLRLCPLCQPTGGFPPGFRRAADQVA